MTNIIQQSIQEKQMGAEMHASFCRDLLAADKLAEALNYCKEQGIEAPQCSLTADSPNARKLREVAKNLLSDEKWWQKRLKLHALRNYEQQQIVQGNVTNGISDEMSDFLRSEK